MGKITDKDYKDFMILYHNKDFSLIKKFKGNKLSKFVFFMLFSTGSYGNINKIKEYETNYIYNLLFQINDIKDFNISNLELFEYIYKFKAIKNLKNLSFNHLLEYILFCVSKNHLPGDIILSLAYLFKK